VSDFTAVSVLCPKCADECHGRVVLKANNLVQDEVCHWCREPGASDSPVDTFVEGTFSWICHKCAGADLARCVPIVNALIRGGQFDAVEKILRLGKYDRARF
jgi:hypothetical protein